MLRRTVLLTRTLFLAGVLLASTGLSAQRERQIPPPDNGEFGSKFFTQLRSIFGRFRDADLQRVFQLADPIQCSELLSGKGEWRPVAFINEKRELGDWYRSSLAEVRSDLSVYVFKGTCQGERSNIELTTKYPVGDSISAFNNGQIPFSEIDVNVNAPVKLTYDSRSGAYSFDLPFLYLVSRQSTSNIYSLIPPHFGDKYATDVTNAWECKAVSSIDITYRFIICRTSTVDRSSQSKNQRSAPSFGSSAYFILSDGSEAQSTVTLNFGAEAPEPTPAGPAPAAEPVDTGAIAWQAPAYRSQIVDVGDSEFRIRFNPSVWTTRIGSLQVISNQNVASLATAKPAEGADYCVWTPNAANMVSRLLTDNPDTEVSYSASGLDRGGGQSTASVTFVMKALTGTRIGSLQCFFPRTNLASEVGYDRFATIVGGQLKLEVRGK